MEMNILSNIVGFNWDQGNQHKNWKKHQVSSIECEEVFFNTPLLLYEDIKHSANENRMYALGKTEKRRLLFIAFTIRKQLIRVISARDMHSVIFMKKLKKTPAFTTLQEEKTFWESHDSTEYIDWSKAKLSYFPNLKPSTQTISLRLPASMLIELKILAHKQDIPYQSLMKLLLSEGIDKFREQHVG